MKGSQLTVYAANQSHRVKHMSVVDWILDESKRAGIQGATVVEIAEGVDAKGKYHAARFFELDDQPVCVTVIAADPQIDALLAQLRGGGIRLFYTRGPIEYDTLGADGDTQ
jgi:PII-like signaling protein